MIFRRRPASSGGSTFARALFGTPLYRLTLLGPAPRQLTRLPPAPWPGDAARGSAIVQGSLAVGAQRIDLGRPPWREGSLDAAAASELHGFSWLDDLAAVGGADAQARARALVADWIANDSGWDALAWRPDILGSRLAAWLAHAPFLAQGHGDSLGPALLRSATRQHRHLVRVAGTGPAGLGRLLALRGLIFGALAGLGEPAHVERGLRLLGRELSLQVLPDGGHIERSPSRHGRALRALVDIRTMLEDSSRAPPPWLDTTIERMAPMLRFLRHGDGGLALFNGAGEETAAAIDLMLARAGARARPPSDAPDSGFERLAAERVLIIVDGGAPPPRGYDTHAHAGTLAFEFSVGKERLIVNCGAQSPADPAWRLAQRSTAAHSTLTIDDTNSAEITQEGGFGRRPLHVERTREEADGNVWLTLSHDGYQPNFGLIHRRRLYLAHDGGDLRGEDVMIGHHAGQFAARFHLHPDVQASLIQNGAAVLLRLPSGAAWRFQAAGATIQLMESIYLGRVGETRRTEQIVVAGGLAGDPTAIKWAFKRVPKL